MKTFLKLKAVTALCVFRHSQAGTCKIGKNAAEAGAT
jgi:hypothetical protein